MIETARKIKLILFTIIILALSLFFMLRYFPTDAKEENVHIINLNDSMPIIDESSATFKPGDTLTKYFFVENLSEKEIYYTLYFENIEGPLKDTLEVTIYDQDEVILSGTLGKLTRNAKREKQTTLAPYEKKDLLATFYFPKSGDNSLKSSTVYFDLNARAEWTQ